MPRDYRREMRELIEERESAGPYQSRTLAENLVNDLRGSDLDLLNGWLFYHAAKLLWLEINEIDRGRRTAARDSGPFADAVGEAEAGKPEKLGKYLSTSYVIAADNTRDMLGNLKAPELNFVAKNYEAQSKSLAFEAVFFRALAKRVGADKVSDVFTDDQIAEFRKLLV